MHTGPYRPPEPLPESKLLDIHCHTAGIGAGDGRIGLQLDDVDLALRLAAEPAQTGLSLSTPKTWLALRAQAAEAAVVGTDQIVAVVLEEMGRALLCAPYFSSVVLAANTLLLSGDDAAKKAHLPGIAAGETIATLATTEPSGRWDEAGITIEAKGSGSDFTISGTKSFVLDGHTANLIIVAARTGKGVSRAAESRSRARDRRDSSSGTDSPEAARAVLDAIDEVFAVDDESEGEGKS